MGSKPFPYLAASLPKERGAAPVSAAQSRSAYLGKLLLVFDMQGVVGELQQLLGTLQGAGALRELILGDTQDKEGFCYPLFPVVESTKCKCLLCVYMLCVLFDLDLESANKVIYIYIYIWSRPGCLPAL